MTTEQRTGFRLPWSSDRHAAAPSESPSVEAAPADEDDSSLVPDASTAAEVAEPAADELDPTRAGGPAAVVDSGDDGAAGSWVLGSWAGREVGGRDDASADPSDQPAAGGPTDGDPSSDASPASRLTWPAEDIARATAHATATRNKSHTAAATDAQMADETPAEMPEHDAAQEVTAMSPSSAPALAAPASAAGAAAPAGATVGSKPTKFMVELSRAMQTAAQASREESLARLAAEAKGRIEEIQQLGSSGTTELRRKADDDVAATREWSKAEIARIREETEHRISERKGRLEADVERHIAMVRRRGDLVREAVTRHETELAAFIEQLMAEEDPGRIATLAQHMPEPPVLDEIDADDEARPSDGESAQAMATTMAAETGSAAGEAAEAVGSDAAADAGKSATGAGPQAEIADHLSAETAAEAEALAGLDAGKAGDDAWFSSTSGDARNGTGDDAAGRTELIVTGLTGVAGIAGFKRELSRLVGVHSVGVSAGQAGEFVFAVSHDAGLDLGESIPSMTAFEAQVTGRRTGSLLVTATEPAAGE